MYPFGVPYETLVSGVRVGWESSLGMCREMFRDTEVAWVREYMLRSRPRRDAYAMTYPANYFRSMSTVFRGGALPQPGGGFSSTLSLARLVIPVESFGDLGVGIGVDSTSAEGALGVPYPSRETLFRCVTNNRRHTFMYFTDHERAGYVSTLYATYGKDGVWLSALATFNRTAFFEAFKKDIDYEKLNQHLMQTVVAVVKHKQRPVIMANALYPDRVAENIGDHLLKVVYTSHANGQTMMTLPISSTGTWTFNHDKAELRKMLNWGITDRMHKIRPSPCQDLLITSGNLSLNKEV